MTDLKNKAVNIKGKLYVLVSDRIVAFNKDNPQGSITTELLSPFDSQLIVMRATATPDGVRKFTGYSQATIGDGYINKTSALENCETSAVGRALAMMGIGVIDSIASVDEINKAQTYPTTKKAETKNVDTFLADLQPTDEEVITWQEKLESAKTVKELKDFWVTVPPMVQDKLAKLKDELKFKLA